MIRSNTHQQRPTARIRLRSKADTITDLMVGEDGGAYTLSYVMVVPITMLLMCLIIETTLMMSAKLGTVYAAYAAARVGSVWSSATDWPSAKSRVEQAAVKAFIPFASGVSATNPSADGDADVSRYWKSYQSYVDRPAAQGYVRKKYRDAEASLEVIIDGPPPSWDADFTVTVRYRCPFRLPGIGRLIGEANPNGGYYFPLSSKVTLQNEAPQNESQTLGIGYGILE